MLYGCVCFKGSSIHPSIFMTLIRVVLRTKQDKQSTPNISLKELSSSSSWEMQKHSQAKCNIYSLQRVLSLPWGLLPVAHAQKTSKGRRPTGILIRGLNHLSWLLSKQMSKILSLFQRVNPTSSFQLLVSTILFFPLLCKACDHR